MKRIMQVEKNLFIIEGEYHPRREFNYYVYDIRGNRPFETGYISVNGQKKSLCVPIAFRRLSDASRWLKDGCPIRKELTLVWAVHSKQAALVLSGGEE